jgi:hypothetical protein
MGAGPEAGVTIDLLSFESAGEINAGAMAGVFMGELVEEGLGTGFIG